MRQKKEKNLRREALLFFRDFAIAAMVALLVSCTLVVNAVIPTGSMESTVMTGDRILGNRLAYVFSKPQRGDIIIFEHPDDASIMLIKRIIGMPGEKIEIIDGKVYIGGGGEPLDEPYLNEPPLGSFGPYEVPEGSYFVMGDNRNESLDSRFWEHHFVNRDEIKAKAGLRYYPGIKIVE